MATHFTDSAILSTTGAHHAPDGRFRNPWPGAELHGFKDFLKWRLGERRNRRIAPDPTRDSLPLRAPAIVAPRAATGYRSITWVGHATLLLQLGPLNVLTDPMWSERASPFQFVGPRRLMRPGLAFDQLPEIDLVLLSHNHYDHLDERTTRRLAERFPNATWVCPLRVGQVLRSFGVRAPVERDWWESVDSPAFSAIATPAQHFSARGLGDRNETLWCGWALRTEEANVFFAGDTALHPEFGAIADRLGPFDVVMLPIGAYEPRWFMRAVHMDPDDAMHAYRAIATASATAPACIPIHWGTFRLTDEPVEEAPRRFAELWEGSGYPGSTNWTLADGETRQF